jgi:hypothetical protein
MKVAAALRQDSIPKEGMPTMPVTALSQVSPWPDQMAITLADIAILLGVPVVIATNTHSHPLRSHSTFGLDFGVNWAQFAAAVDAQCVKGASIIPNIEKHPELSRWSASLIRSDIRFFAGVPLCDVDGWRVGSIAVIAEQKAVARKGIPIRRLGELGRQFVGLE